MNEKYLFRAIKNNILTTHKGFKTPVYKHISELEFMDGAIYEVFQGERSLGILVQTSNQLEGSEITMIFELGFGVSRLKKAPNLYYIDIKDKKIIKKLSTILSI